MTIQLKDFVVELPVNAQGKPTGKSISWPATKSYKPWYVRGRTSLTFICPEKGATTSPGRAPRCELKQTKTWTKSTLKFRMTLLKIGAIQTIAQARQKGGSAEMFQLRAFADGTLQIRTNKSLNSQSIGTFKLGTAFKFEVSMEKGGSIICKLHGVQVAKVKLTSWPGAQIWKGGLYGRGGGEAKISTWEIS